MNSFTVSSVLKKLEGLSLKQILLLATLFRITSAIFSTGYAMHDDHFNVIEVAQSWADGKNVGGWLPDSVTGESTEVSHSLFYPGIHYLLFCFFNFIGLHDPQLKMVFVRLLHALYSLLIVFYTFKITEKLSNTINAKYAALLVALLWFMPNLSVRNLVEMVCIPPLLAGYWFLLKEERPRVQDFLLSGFVMAFAFSIRYQTALFLAGVGFVLLVQKQWKGFFLFSTGAVLNVLIFQCTCDMLLWHYPLAEFLGYIQYNIVHKTEFIKGFWFNYLLLVTGMILPPFSLWLWKGYFSSYKKSLLLFLPSLLFFVFHSYFVNKQERFILPFLPFLIIGGFTGLQNLNNYVPVNNKLKKILGGILVTVIILNTILLAVVSVASSKTSRMDALYFLYKQKDTEAYIVESSYTEGWQFFPRFYLGKWCNEYFLPKGETAENIKNSIHGNKAIPNYVIFLSDKELQGRIGNFQKAFPNIEPVAEIQPSFIDRLFFKLNPMNKNEPCFIYRIKY